MRIGIVDDHPVFRLGLRRALDREPEIKVLWDVGTAREAGQLVSGTPVDIILMDVRLGDDAGGLQATHELAMQQPATKIVMLSALSDEHVIRAARRAGAVGYLPKDVRPDQLARALQDIATTSRPWSRVGLGGVIESPRYSGVRRVGVSSSTKAPRGLLSARELEVLIEIRAGRTNREISARLGISTSTVNKHVRHILRKLGVRNRAHAAGRLPLIETGDPKEAAKPKNR